MTMVRDTEEVKIAIFRRVYGSENYVYVKKKKKNLLNNILILGHVPNQDVQKVGSGHAKEKDSENGTEMHCTHYRSAGSMNYTEGCGQIFYENFM